MAGEQSVARRGLYLMTKPPAAVAELVWNLPRADKTRDPSQLHITLLPLFDLAYCSAELLTDLVRVMAGFEGPAFRVVFDQIVERRYVMLCGSEPIWGARRFQELLRRFLTGQGFRSFRRPSEAHMTLRYGRDGLGDEPIDPVSWRAEELLLIESVGGKHILRGKWQLHIG